eukprot:CAMPEP_0172824628 /NCGR_PEP_ID=MMETSP1075-20121228/18133_1 /TAXON_ID=2916 /ORGANISM="Ceratium fusus, Strain PA161109" /LENGTH=438 /DNA_ID=CAMNT_0013665939 /DNA_START=37 /DNA_END=1353 /DNA_ORIENTATION=+
MANLAATPDMRPAGERRFAIDKYLTWNGCKYDARRLIAWCVPAEARRVVSPFFGSGAVELELVRSRLNLHIEGSDLDCALTLFWQAMLSSSDEVAKRVGQIVPRSRPVSREEFEHMRPGLGLARRSHQASKHDRIPAQGDASISGRTQSAVVAARYWVMNTLAFSGNMGCLAYNGNRAKKLCHARLKWLAHLRTFKAPALPGRLSVTHRDAYEAIAGCPKDALLFLDPPYLDRTTASQRYYSCGPNWGVEKHRDLRKMLDRHERWIMCHEDIPAIRKLYEGFRILKYAKASSGARSRTHVGKHGTIAQGYRRELLILSDWVAKRLPAGEPPIVLRGGDGSCPDCLKCGGRRKRVLRKGALVAHRCPLSGRRSAGDCCEKCAVCNALLPTGRREGVHQEHCKNIFPELWKAHRGPVVLGAKQDRKRWPASEAPVQSVAE